jgi:hypothetical protein
MSQEPPKEQPQGPVQMFDVPGYVEAFRRYLIEDALIVIASELLSDAAAIEAMQRLGVHGRMVQLIRAVFHWRANPETKAETEMAETMRKLPIASRPKPFNEVTKPKRQGFHTS